MSATTPAKTSNGLPTWINHTIENFSPERRRAVLDFIEYLELRGNSQHSIGNYVKSIAKLGSKGKPFGNLTREDLVNWLRKLPKMGNNGGYSKSSLATFKGHVKRFLKWVHNGDGADTPLEKMPVPECAKCIDGCRASGGLPKNILSKEEVKKLVKAAKHERDRALIFVTYETGARAGEVLGLKIGDIRLDEYGAVLVLSGKTGSRRVRIVEAVPELQLWLDTHGETDPKASLWPSMRAGKPLSLSGFGKLLNEAAKAAGLKKNVFPHLLRHSRATHLAGALTEAQLREVFGWSKSSDMPSKYVHLAGRDVDSALLAYYGIKERKREDGKALRPITCPRCKMQNSASAAFCSRCSLPLGEKLSKTLSGDTPEDQVVAKVTEWLISNAPEMVEKAMRETKASEDMRQLLERGGNTEKTAC